MGRKKENRTTGERKRTGQQDTKRKRKTKKNRTKQAIRCVDKLRKLSQKQPATSQRKAPSKKKLHKTCRTRQTSSSQRWHHVHKQLSIDLDNIATHKKITKQRHQAFTAVTEDTTSAKCGGGQVVPRLIKFSRHNTRTKTGLWTLDLRPIQT